MHRYFFLVLLLVTIISLSSQEAARIGKRSYTEDELNQGFEAYLSYLNIGNISHQDSLALFSQYFKQLIGMYIYNMAIVDSAIQVDEAELEKEIRENPPEGIYQMEEFKSEGKFDFNKYHQALDDNLEFKHSVMGYSREAFAYHKLLQSIRNKAVIDTNAVEKRWLEAGSTADAKIIKFDYSGLVDIEVEIEEALKLYEENKQDYLRTNGRKIKYVAFSGLSSRELAGSRQEFEQKSKQLHEFAQKLGLEKAAEKLGYQVTDSAFFCIDDEIIRGIGKDSKLVKNIFAHAINTLLPIYTNPVGDIFIIQVAEEKQEFYIPFELEQSILMGKAKALKRKEALKEKVSTFITEHKQDEYLNAAVGEGFKIIEAKNIRQDSLIEGIGKIEKLNLAILSSEEMSFSPLVEENGLYYIAWVTRRVIRTKRSWNAQKNTILAAALKQAQDDYLAKWYSNRQEKLDIVYPSMLQNLDQ
ncbi:MAG: SurA N-terminal domain-containing protein [Candidatus Cloacimonetes bacterium]|nr:SurA N-terminal domain-containing protein [Candidatus Cloacimonadota bacterium]